MSRVKSKTPCPSCGFRKCTVKVVPGIRVELRCKECKSIFVPGPAMPGEDMNWVFHKKWDM